ncbi:MAG: type II secretion system F family protein [Phenylobacterium sp.]|uniref:type II secretion system F family protein n=1 Tax=Phenylobacterium sp. TaxID=1871053 RepID=UPI00391B996B
MFDDLLLPLALVLGFLAAAAAAEGLLSSFLAARDRKQRLTRRLRQGGAHSTAQAELIREGGWGAAASPFHALRVGLERRLAQADLAVSPQAFAAYTLGAGAGLWLVSTAVMRMVGAGGEFRDSLISLLGCMILAATAAWAMVSRRRGRRLKLLETQLPLALDVIVRALRAGHPVISAVRLVTEELGDPLAREFELIVDETTYGVEFREALGNFARRSGSPDAHFFAVSVAIQAETGGNLAEILNNLAAVIRGRIALGKRVKALASEGRMSAALLSVLPILLISFMFITQPSFYVSKFDDPIFWPVVAVVAALYGAGQAIMHRIVNFRY